MLLHVINKLLNLPCEWESWILVRCLTRVLLHSSEKSLSFPVCPVRVLGSWNMVLRWVALAALESTGICQPLIVVGVLEHGAVHCSWAVLVLHWSVSTSSV